MILLKVLIRTLMNTKGIFGLLFKFCSASWLGKIKKGAKSAAVKGDPLKTNPFRILPEAKKEDALRSVIRL